MSDVLYVVSLAAPHTVDTMLERTLLALADHGEIAAMLPHDGGDSWEDLLACIGEKSETLRRAG